VNVLEERETALGRAPGLGSSQGGAEPRRRRRCARPVLSSGQGRRGAAGDRVIVRVVDRGPGIPPASSSGFEPFYRAWQRRCFGTAARGWAGHRRGFTEASAGSLHVERSARRCATSCFEFPLQDATGERPDAEPSDGVAMEGQIASDRGTEPSA